MTATVLDISTQEVTMIPGVVAALRVDTLCGPYVRLHAPTDHAPARVALHCPHGPHVTADPEVLRAVARMCSTAAGWLDVEVDGQQALDLDGVGA